MPFLEIKNIKTHFQKKRGGLFSRTVDTVKAVDGVSIAIEKGEILGLVGESGCGKSTLLRAFSDLVEPSTGEISVNGKMPAEARAARGIPTRSQSRCACFGCTTRPGMT